MEAAATKAEEDAAKAYKAEQDACDAEIAAARKTAGDAKIAEAEAQKAEEA